MSHLIKLFQMVGLDNISLRKMKKKNLFLKNFYKQNFVEGFTVF